MSGSRRCRRHGDRASASTEAASRPSEAPARRPRLRRHPCLGGELSPTGTEAQRLDPGGQSQTSDVDEPDGISSDGSHISMTNADDRTRSSRLDASNQAVVSRTIEMNKALYGVSPDGAHISVNSSAGDTMRPASTPWTGAVVPTHAM